MATTQKTTEGSRKRVMIDDGSDPLELLESLLPGATLWSAGDHFRICELEMAGFKCKDTVQVLTAEGTIFIRWMYKEPEGSWTDNLIKYGVGAVNVDECRVKSPLSESEMRFSKTGKYSGPVSFGLSDYREPQFEDTGLHNPKGRFPANLILSHHADCVKVGVKKVKSKSGGVPPYHKGGSPFTLGIKTNKENPHYHDPDGLETVEAWECSPECPVRLLDEQSGVTTSSGGKIGGGIAFGKNNQETTKGNPGLGDTGGASRFFKQVQSLQEALDYLIKLVT